MIQRFGASEDVASIFCGALANAQEVLSLIFKARRKSRLGDIFRSILVYHESQGCDALSLDLLAFHIFTSEQLLPTMSPQAAQSTDPKGLIAAV
ncbi:MAG: hypothetical protein KDB14_21130 [Planctomycetales bacterium]|nr:hypothetical protein [Planctomycetales bacterium]